MKKTSLVLMSLAVFAFVFVGCKKYEEGPTISLASKKNRVVNTWVIEKIINNGTDITQAYLLLFPDFSMEMKKDNTYIITYSGSSAETGTWDFDSKKEHIVTTPSGGSSATTYEILMLKSKEIWVKEVDGNDVIESHYKAK
jgi:hypothetical protein